MEVDDEGGERVALIVPGCAAAVELFFQKAKLDVFFVTVWPPLLLLVEADETAVFADED